MTRAIDLADWLKAQLFLRSVAVESPLSEDALPGAMVHYQGGLPGDTLNPVERQEQYQVGFVANAVGADPNQVQAEIAKIEARLMCIIRGPQRASVRWNHITATLVGAERQSGMSLWLFTLWVEGE